MNTSASPAAPYIARRLTVLQLISIVIVVLLGLTYLNLQRSIATSEHLMETLLKAESAVREMQTQMHLSEKADLPRLLSFLKVESESLTMLHQALVDQGLADRALTSKRLSMLNNLDQLIAAGLSLAVKEGQALGSVQPILDGLLFTLDSLYENLQSQQSEVRSRYAGRIASESHFMGGLLLSACLLILMAVRLIRTRVLAPVSLLTARCRKAAEMDQPAESSMPASVLATTDNGDETAKFPIHDDEIGQALKAVDSLHQHLQGVNSELNKQVAFKTNFVSQISHEIRTPINSIVGLCQVSLNEKGEAKKTDALHQINKSARYLVSLVNHVLDYQKMSAGKLVLQLDVVDVESVLEGLVSAFEHQAHRKGLGFFVSKALEAPNYFMGDKTRIEQVLFNLTSNAIKFTTKGFVTVSFGIKDKRLVFSVKDTGPGISDDQQRRLFQPFYQTQAGVKFGEGGTGLGLTLSMNLAKLMKGSIEVVSTPGKGAVFSMDLPFEPASKAIVVEPEGADGMFNIFGRRLRVLVVDDHRINLKVNSTLLRNAGFQTTMASSGEDAVAMVLDRVGTDQDFDAVLMDVHLEGISGIDAVRQIKAALPGNQCPVIVPLTAGITPDERDEMAELGILEILPKPFEVAYAKRLICDMVLSRSAITRVVG